MTNLKKFEQHKYNDFLSKSNTNEDDKYFEEDYMFYLKNKRKYFKNMDKKLENPYGYKVCYSTKKRKRKLIDKVHTNTYGLAQFEKQRLERISEDSKNPLYRATWYIVPIKKREFNKIWRNCPF